jgi:hypothetical protein
MATSGVLGYRNSSTYHEGTLPGFGAPAALLDDHFDRLLMPLKTTLNCFPRLRLVGRSF